MSVVVSKTRERQEQRRRRKLVEQAPKPKFRILVRYKYYTHKWIDVEEVGTFRELWRKHKDDPNARFYCADIPPNNINGKFDDDNAYMLNGEHLINYGSHKTWLDPELSRLSGKQVYLTFNAG